MACYARFMAGPSHAKPSTLTLWNLSGTPFGQDKANQVGAIPPSKSFSRKSRRACAYPAKGRSSKWPVPAVSSQKRPAERKPGWRKPRSCDAAAASGLAYANGVGFLDVGNHHFLLLKPICQWSYLNHWSMDAASRAEKDLKH